MTHPHEPTREQQLNAYLDGLLNEAERAAFEAGLRDDPQCRREVALQARIDRSLERLFAVDEPSEDMVAELTARLAATQKSRVAGRCELRAAQRVVWIAAVAAAAVVAWALVAWRLGDRVPDAPVFTPQSVVTLYRACLANGFQPYYECRDDLRFAATFARRLGQPLRLLPFPEDNRMLGLSYPGGISRDTTAMLCRIDDQPVMVFVDRLESDHALAMQNDDPSLRVFRREMFDLVFYEVTPLDVSRVIDHLASAEDPVDQSR